MFIDEAGHLTEPEVLVPLCLLHSSVGQLVLAGDPQQLGPTLTSTAWAQCFQGGLSDHLDRSVLHLSDHLQSSGQIRQVELEVAGAFLCDQAPRRVFLPEDWGLLN